MMQSAAVNLAPPVADFTADPVSGFAPLEVVFTDASLNGPTSYAWDFGDGNTSNEANPVHTYMLPGVYTASLTVSNEFGQSSANTEITVEELTTLAMHVEDITVSRVSAPGNRNFGEAVVLVLDQAGDPVPGALVSAVYSGEISGEISGTTDATGTVILETRAAKGTLPWCFEIVNITRSGYTYLPADNTSSGACESALKGLLAGDTDNMIAADIVNFPNPFTRMTHIRFTLASRSDVTIEIFNSAGQLTATLEDRPMEAGEHIVTWKPMDVPGGIYYIRFNVDGQVMTRSMLRVNR